MLGNFEINSLIIHGPSSIGRLSLWEYVLTHTCCLGVEAGTLFPLKRFLSFFINQENNGVIMIIESVKDLRH